MHILREVLYSAPSVTHEFEIPISELDAGGKDYRFVLRPAWIRAALEDSDASTAGTEGLLTARISKSGTDVVVHGKLAAELVATCGRCLQPAHVHVAQDVAALFAPKSALKSGGKEYEFSAEEADVLPYEGETLVLDDLVRDELLLEIPIIPLCSEDCQGIAPPPFSEQSVSTPDTSDAIDPRLAPLLQIKPSRNSKE